MSLCVPPYCYLFVYVYGYGFKSGVMVYVLTFR